MIRPLDNTTVRRISSGQVITKVEDVVKELVENSIDAESTSIEVKLVGDGLTSITVKDNGVGIQECDRPAMAMRYHTSKLYKFEDLSIVETYGFRGEALNSICAVTESTQIITKTENDPVATLYTLDRSGKILDEKSMGSSPGTTVIAVKLFSNIPVRRQVAQKSTSTGKNVQNILITYALAHPHIRFSLKQTYENNSKIKFKEGDWVQPAMKNTMDAIIKLFGSELANEVQFCVWSSDAELIETSENVNVDDNNNSNNLNNTQQFIITLEAVLPNPDADPYIIFKNGKTFIYVNNRPVTTSRGETKSLVSMVKSVYNEIARQSGWKGNPKTPFMLINIKLPTWAYDINVEPSKNVALFHYGERLVETVSNLLEMIYDPSNQQKEQNTSIAKDVDQPDQPVESVIDDDDMNDSENVHVEEITVDQLERVLTKTSDNLIKDDHIIQSELYVETDNLPENDDQLLYSPSRSESSYRNCQRASGTTPPIHDHEAAETLIMISGVQSTEKPTNKDMRQYMRQEIHPVRDDKVKQRMNDHEFRKRNNVTKKNDNKSSNTKDGTIDNWLKNCQTQDVDISYTPPYDEPQTINPEDDDVQGNNFTRSPPRNPHSYRELSSYNNLNSGDSRDPSRNATRDTYNELLPQNNRKSGDLLLTPPSSKSIVRDTALQPTTHTNNLHEHPHGNVANSRNDQGTQLECYTMDSDDPFVDDATAKRVSNDIVNDDTAEPIHKRPRIDNMNDNMGIVFAPETSENDVIEFEGHDSTVLLHENDNILQSETEVDINSNQLNNDNNGQSQRKERTIAIGQPTIDDLLKSGAIKIPQDTNNKNMATNVNAQLQQLKKKSDNRLASSLTDVLNQELKLKFNKLKVMERNKTTFCNQIGYSLSCFNKLDYGMWTVTRKFNEKFMDILMVHGERIRELVTLETLVTSTELNPTRKLLNPIDVTIEQLGSAQVIECLKRLTFDQIPDESGAGIWWNMVTQKCLTANGIKVRWREDNNSKIYIQLTHISPLVQFATAVEYFVHLMKHLCCLNADNDKDIPFVNTRARLTMRILAREARQMVKHEDWTINKRDDEMKQRVKDATAHLMHRIKDFGCNSPDREDDEIDELTPFAMVKKKNDEEIWYNGEMVVKILWKNIEEVNSQ